MSVVKVTEDGVFGVGELTFGGSFVPNLLQSALDKVTQAFNRSKDDPTFIEERGWTLDIMLPP